MFLMPWPEQDYPYPGYVVLIQGWSQRILTLMGLKRTVSKRPGRVVEDGTKIHALTVGDRRMAAFRLS
jgi:hypothetical protein